MEARVSVAAPYCSSGLRSLRYLAELQDEVLSAVANDLDPHAVRTIRRNAALNRLPPNKLYGTGPRHGAVMSPAAAPTVEKPRNRLGVPRNRTTHPTFEVPLQPGSPGLVCPRSLVTS